MRRVSALLPAAVLILAAVLVACGEPDDQGAAAPDATSSPTAQIPSPTPGEGSSQGQTAEPLIEPTPPIPPASAVIRGTVGDATTPPLLMIMSTCTQ